LPVVPTTGRIGSESPIRGGEAYPAAGFASTGACPQDAVIALSIQPQAGDAGETAGKSSGIAEIIAEELSLMGQRNQFFSVLGLAVRPFRLAIVAAAAFLAASAPAVGQGAVKSVHGDWQIRCDTPAGAQAEQCALIQSVVAEDRSNAGLTVIILKTADQKSKLMRVVAPLGVLLPSGLGLKLDDKDVGRAGFVRCLPNGCVAEVVMEDTLLNQLKTAKTATFIIFETPEEGIGFPLSLKGLGEGYDKLP
jgi:invasion protein IalB